MATATPTKPAADSARNHLSWAAGFFDGEGTVTMLGGTRLMVAVEQNATPDLGCPAVLSCFAQAVGVGRLGGPYFKNPTKAYYSPRRRPTFKWWAYEAEAVVALRRLIPFLIGPKQNQAQVAIHRLTEGINS